MNRLKKIKYIRKKLKDGKLSIGSWMQTFDSNIAEIMGELEYDWITIDLEHGAADFTKLPDMCRSIELGNTLPIVRVASADEKDCKHSLDSGAGGVIVPNIEDAKQLEHIVSSCSWPPKGKRGVGFSRANLYGRFFTEYKSEAQSPLIIAMIESQLGVRNIESILSTPGLDAILIGPYDLSASLGITGDFKNYKFKKTIETILKTCQKLKIPAGIHQVEPSIDELKKKIKYGYQFIAYSVDTVFINHFAQNPILEKNK